MNTDLVPPLVAAAVAVALTIRQYLVAILIELPVDVPPRTLANYAVASRFAAFVLVYGLLFGVAYWAGSKRTDAPDAATTAAVTLVVAAVVTLVATAAVLQFVGPGTRELLLSAGVVVGRSVATGVELAVVVLAGVALPRQLRAWAENPEPNR